MENIPQSRRKFITSLALLLVSGGLLLRYLTPRTTRKRKILVSVAASEVPINGALLFRSERLVLLRDEKGYNALSLICTHLGCTVTVTADTLACPCHGSLFDRRGLVLKGPADKPLEKLELVEHNGMIEVYGA